VFSRASVYLRFRVLRAASLFTGDVVDRERPSKPERAARGHE